MTVSELRAILNTLPDDLEVKVNHWPHGYHNPELFLNSGSFPSLLIIPSSNERELAMAKKLPHWRHISKVGEA